MDQESQATIITSADEHGMVPTSGPRVRLYTLVAHHMCGYTLRIGSVSVREGIHMIDTLLTPNGWTPRFEPRSPINPMPRGDAHRVLTAGTSDPIAGTELFVALRAAVYADPDDNDEHDQATTLLAHIEPHRPWATFTGDPDCLDGGCGPTNDHPTCDIKPATPLCSACTPVYEDGSEFTPAWLDACRITWPCAPLRAVADHYQVPLDELVRQVPGCV